MEVGQDIICICNVLINTPVTHRFVYGDGIIASRYYIMDGQGQRQTNGVGGGMCPVSTRPIAGTSWSEVRTNTGHVYYYCQKTGTSTWEMPEEVKRGGVQGNKQKRRSGVPRVIDDRMMKAMKRAKAHGATLAPEYEEMLSGKGEGGSKKQKVEEKNTPVEMTEAFDVTFDEEDIVEDDIVKDRGGYKEHRSDVDTKEGFFSLLAELGIHAFSRFEKELARMQNDTRFIAVEDISKRKAYFEEFCKGQSVMKKKSKESRVEKKEIPIAVDRGEDQMKRRKDAFTALLQEKVLKSTLKWHDILHVLEKDDRFADIESEEQRKDLFYHHKRKLEKAERAKYLADTRMKRDIQAGKERQMDSNRRDACMNYKALLTEMVRDPEALWESEAETLRSDPQGRASCIDQKTAKEMFESHVKEMYELHRKRLVDLYGKNGIPPSLSFADASANFEDDMLEYSESLQRDAWKVYTAR